MYWEPSINSCIVGIIVDLGLNLRIAIFRWSTEGWHIIMRDPECKWWVEPARDNILLQGLFLSP